MLATTACSRHESRKGVSCTDDSCCRWRCCSSALAYSLRPQSRAVRVAPRRKQPTPARQELAARSGTVSRTDIDYVDPALAYYVPSWAIMYSTAAMLVNYPDAPAPRGSRIVPEVAAGLPRISRNGLTYTFQLKRTYRLSNGQRVTAANFVYAINRALNRRMNSPAQPFIEDIAGAEAVIAGRAQRATGVRALGPTRCRSASRSGLRTWWPGWQCRSSRRSRRTCRSSRTASAPRCTRPVRTTSPAGSRPARLLCSGTASIAVRVRTTSTRSSSTSGFRRRRSS